MIIICVGLNNKELSNEDDKWQSGGHIEWFIPHV